MTNEPIDPSRIVHTELLPGARSWSFIIRRGFALRLTDRRGRANCSALFFNAHEKLERYNMADTLKAQHTAFLTAGHVCYSDMGRILVSITEDTCGWHDTFCGVSDAALVRERFGVARYQEARNSFLRNGRELFLIELGKWGLGRRDLVANVNFFSKVAVDEAGVMRFEPGHSKPGDHVDLRAEMDTLVVLNTCPHPLDPATEWSPKPVDLAIYRADPAAEDDLCRISCPENGRGFANTAIYHCQL
ncbi:Urea carboxylase-associated protein 2 [Thiocapsa sp. KS1]|nr:urea amidolyase associated protein UAAP1 [Thiocapsa sp. KS1]CRI63671.1 Urea carboxylase-associated protein 2 [Thiocapsa sp. KS1]